jgi:hypothetical protein
MTVEDLRKLVRKWDLEQTGDPAAKSEYGFILDQLDYHATKEWRVYLPAENPVFNPSYIERLAAWIGNVTVEADQKLLLKYAARISFFSHDDFAALYRTAMDREISRWVASQIPARLEPHGWQSFHELIEREIHRYTWFCPITDSMDINEFHKVNHLQGVGYRPGFAALQMIAENRVNPNPQLAGDWIRYMANPSSDPLDPTRRRPPLTRIVLLEDIVGSASQCRDAIRWAVSNLGVPVLFVPLILCPNGVQALRDEEALSGGRLTVRPVIELRRSDLLGPERNGEPGCPIADELEDLATRCAGRSSVNMDTFGYRNTGCSLTTFSNTPDNTLPIVHHKPASGAWEPLFPRIDRD